MREERTMLRRAMMIAVALLPYTAASAADLILQCDDPKGVRVSFGTFNDLQGKPIQSTSDGIKWEDDGYTNVRPIFIWKEETPSKLLVSWGDTLPDILLGRIEPKQHTWTADVTYRSKDEIQGTWTACGSGGCTTNIVALFPNLGFMVRSDVFLNEPLLPLGKLGSASTVASQCKRLAGQE